MWNSMSLGKNAKLKNGELNHLNQKPLVFSQNWGLSDFEAKFFGLLPALQISAPRHEIVPGIISSQEIALES